LIRFIHQWPVELELTLGGEGARRKARGIQERDGRTLLADLVRQRYAMQAPRHHHIRDDEVQLRGTGDDREGRRALAGRQDGEPHLLQIGHRDLQQINLILHD
jgi:hypothetical protein